MQYKYAPGVGVDEMEPFAVVSKLIFYMELYDTMSPEKKSYRIYTRVTYTCIQTDKCITSTYIHLVHLTLEFAITFVVTCMINSASLQILIIPVALGRDSTVLYNNFRPHALHYTV